MCCGLVKKKNDFTICTLLLIDVYSIFLSFYKPHIICLGAQKSHLGETVLLGILAGLKER